MTTTADAAPHQGDEQQSPPAVDMRKEFRSNNRREQRTGPQWFYDEFSAIYRHAAPHGSPSLGQLPTPLPPSATQLREHHGAVVPDSIEQVHTWRERAGGDPVQMLQLCMSLIEVQPRLVSADKQQLALAHGVGREAYRLLKRLVSTSASKRVAGEAQFLLGSCYGTGQLGVPVDHERAFLWYTQASKQNHAEATYRTGVCHELGIGTGHDERRAFMFYRKAAHLAHPTSMLKLALVHWHGYCGQPVHTRDAVSWLQRALAALPAARYRLAMLILYSGNADVLVVPDKRYAVDLLHDAAKHGHAPSQLLLADAFLRGDILDGLLCDTGLAVYWYTRAFQQSRHPEAAIALSLLCLTGSAYPHVGQSDRRAYEWARKAVESAAQRHGRLGTDRWVLAKACYLVAVYTEAGIGVDPSTAESQAAHWFRKAASLGHATAAARRRSGSSSGNDQQQDHQPTDRPTPQRRFRRLQCIAM